MSSCSSISPATSGCSRNSTTRGLAIGVWPTFCPMILGGLGVPAGMEMMRAGGKSPWSCGLRAMPTSTTQSWVVFASEADISGRGKEVARRAREQQGWV